MQQNSIEHHERRSARKPALGARKTTVATATATKLNRWRFRPLPPGTLTASPAGREPGGPASVDATREN